VKKGNFRQDLFFRLNAMHIAVPALRERKKDIPILVKKFATDFCRENHIEFEGFTDSAMHRLQEYHWPGNIRELRNMVEKVIVLEKGDRITDEDIDKYLTPSDTLKNNLPAVLNKPKEEIEKEFLFRALLEIKSEIAQLRELLMSGQVPRYRLGPWREVIENDLEAQDIEETDKTQSEQSVAEMEKNLIQETLNKTGGNKRKTAKLLGLSERTLYRKLDRYGLR
jgi:DNA-binding NtrC family response regulator